MKTSRALLTPVALCLSLIVLAGCQHLDRQPFSLINPPPAPDLRVQYFRFDTIPKEADAARIAAFAEEMPVDGPVHYEVVGHAYDRKQSGYNFQMGKRRANIVGEMLIEAGVPAEKVSVRSLGDTRPRIPYANFGRRNKFNRVEIFRVAPPAETPTETPAG